MHKKCLISFTGGEPFLFKSFDRLIEELPEKHYFFIASNLSMPIDFLETVKKRITAVAASLHPLESQFSLPKFIEKLQFLKECRIFTIVNFVAFPKQIDMIEQMKKEIEDAGFSFNVDPYISSTYQYTEEEQRIVKKFISQKRTVEPWNSPGRAQITEKMCSGGRDYICIVPNGDVFKCNTGFFYSDRDRFRIGNITSKVQLSNVDTPCNVPCPSACDLSMANISDMNGKRLTKPYKDNYFLPLAIKLSHSKYANGLYNWMVRNNLLSNS
jgi:MoaA/NifB/PqqE/SkfB family radical SAM enzyme